MSAPITDAHLDQAIADMTNAFLRWPLPESVNADGCATRQGKGRSGTNLMSVGETLTMMQEVVRPAVKQLIADSEAKAVLRETGYLKALVQDGTNAMKERDQLKAEVERLRNPSTVVPPGSNFCEQDYHTLKARAEKAEAELAKERAHRIELTTLVKRMVVAIRKKNRNDSLSYLAMDYLVRNKLDGEPMRAAMQEDAK